VTGIELGVEHPGQLLVRLEQADPRLTVIV
jgi:regulator of sirC expression with transglutaminase-like and TPR domain